MLIPLNGTNYLLPRMLLGSTPSCHIGNVVFKIIFMKKFIVLYAAPIDAMQQMDGSTSEEKEEGMKAWMEWAASCGGNLVDMGNPLANGTRIVPGGGIAESETKVTGFSVMQAASREEVITLLKDHPHLAWNPDCAIEVHEYLPLPGN